MNYCSHGPVEHHKIKAAECIIFVNAEMDAHNVPTIRDLSFLLRIVCSNRSVHCKLTDLYASGISERIFSKKLIEDSFLRR